jgi:hypothetical protein
MPLRDETLRGGSGRTAEAQRGASFPVCDERASDVRAEAPARSRRSSHAPPARAICEPVRGSAAAAERGFLRNAHSVVVTTQARSDHSRRQRTPTASTFGARGDPSEATPLIWHPRDFPLRGSRGSACSCGSPPGGCSWLVAAGSRPTPGSARSANTRTFLAPASFTTPLVPPQGNYRPSSTMTISATTATAPMYGYSNGGDLPRCRGPTRWPKPCGAG